MFKRKRFNDCFVQSEFVLLLTNIQIPLLSSLSLRQILLVGDISLFWLHATRANEKLLQKSTKRQKAIIQESPRKWLLPSQCGHPVQKIAIQFAFS